MADAVKCPNCAEEHTADQIADCCFLGMLLGVVRDRRGDLTDDEVAHVLRQADADSLWEEFGGPAADYVEGLLKTHIHNPPEEAT